MRQRGCRGFACAAAAVLLMGSLAGSAWGEDKSWTYDPNLTGYWNDPNNWNPSLPEAGDTAIINNKGTASIGDGDSIEVNSLYAGTSDTGAVVQSGGTNMVGSIFYLGYDSGASGTYNLDNGLLTMGGAGEYVGYHGMGTFNQFGGTHTLGGTLYVGYHYSEEGKSRGVYNLSGGLLEANAEVRLGWDTATGIFNQSGGTLTTDTLLIGGGYNTHGIYTISGGSLNVHGNNPDDGLYLQDGAVEAFLDIQGGTVEVEGAVFVSMGFVHVGKDALVTVRQLNISPGGSGSPVTMRLDLTSAGPACIHSISDPNSVASINEDATILDLQTGTYRPNQGDEFHLLVGFGAIDGAFSAITTNLQGWLRTDRNVAINLSDPNTYRPIFSGAAVDANGTYDYVATFQGARPGDATGDNRVDGTDLAALGAAWFLPGGTFTWLEADFNGDGIVNGTDLAALGANWLWEGAWPGPAPAGDAPLPEPATLALLSLGGLAMIRRKHH